MIADTLGEGMCSHLEVALDKCAAQEWAIHGILSSFRDEKIQGRNFKLHFRFQLLQKRHENDSLSNHLVILDSIDFGPKDTQEARSMTWSPTARYELVKKLARRL